MKSLFYLRHLILLLFFLTGCGNKNGDLTPNTETSTFRVDIMQDGDFTKFVRKFTAVETAPAKMRLRFYVYRTTKLRTTELIDEKVYIYDETTKGKIEMLNYKAN